MSRTIQIKRGLKANLPALAVGELGFTIDTHEVFIGSAAGNVPVESKESSELLVQLESDGAAMQSNITQLNNEVLAMSRGLGQSISSLALLNSTYPAGDTKDHIVAGNVKEVATLTVTAIPSVSANVTVTLDGTAHTLLANPLIHITTAALASAIRSEVFAGWVTGGTGNVVTFESTTVGPKGSHSFSGGTSGASATFARTVLGEEANYHRYFWSGTAWLDGGVDFFTQEYKEAIEAQVLADFTAAENARQVEYDAAEAIRQADYLQASQAAAANQELYDGLLEEGVLQTSINSKLAALELEYAPELTTLQQNDLTMSQQLAEIKQNLEVNVKDYGAKGDDLTDDTIAIQSALDAVSNNGGVVKIPSGVYRISRLHNWMNYDGFTQLIVPSSSCLLVKGNNVTIKGDGIGKTILKMMPSDYRELNTLTGSLTTMITLECAVDYPNTNQENIIIEGVELNGGRGQWNEVVLGKDVIGGSGNFDNAAGDGTHSGKGINARTAYGNLTNFKLIRCKIASTYAEGTYSNKAKDSYVEDCIFDYNRPAGGNLSGSITYKRCVFSRAYNFSIEHAHSNELNYMKVIDCDFYDLDNKTGYHIGSGYNTPNVPGSKLEVINNNFHYQHPEVTDRYCGCVASSGYETCIIKGNDMLQKTSEGQGIGHLRLDNMQNIHIIDNDINQDGSPSYWVDNSTRVNGNYTIERNVRKIISGSAKPFSTKLLSETFGVMPNVKYIDNDLVYSGSVGSATTVSNTKSDLTQNIQYHGFGQTKLFAQFNAPTTIQRLYYYSPEGFGGDGVEHDLIENPMTVSSGAVYPFEINHLLNLSKTTTLSGGFNIGVVTTDAVTINYRIMF